MHGLECVSEDEIPKKVYKLFVEMAVCKFARKLVCKYYPIVYASPRRCEQILVWFLWHCAGSWSVSQYNLSIYINIYIIGNLGDTAKQSIYLVQVYRNDFIGNATEVGCVQVRHGHPL